MSSPTIEVLGRVERRRRFSVEQKLAVLGEATAPGANVSAVARQHGLVPAQVYKWRRLAELGVIGVRGASELPSFVAVELAAEPPAKLGAAETMASAASEAPRAGSSRRRLGMIEIDLGGSRRVRVDREVDADALRRVLDVLERR